MPNNQDFFIQSCDAFFTLLESLDKEKIKNNQIRKLLFSNLENLLWILYKEDDLKFHNFISNEVNSVVSEFKTSPAYDKFQLVKDLNNSLRVNFKLAFHNINSLPFFISYVLAFEKIIEIDSNYFDYLKDNLNTIFNPENKRTGVRSYF